MGLALGGLMRQEIYEDKYGMEAWDTSVSRRCFVHILNSDQWRVATGNATPSEPATASQYAHAGLPWYEYYDDSLNALSGNKRLAGMDSVAAKGIKLGEKPLPENKPVQTPNVIPLGSGVGKVTEGKW